jgi:V/A-type H+-transporting ATPase subunit B
LVAIVGEDALSDRDKKFLKFADDFEERFIKQESNEDRSIVQTLTIGWELLSSLPKADLKKIDEKYIKKYLKEPVDKKE